MSVDHFFEENEIIDFFRSNGTFYLRNGTIEKMSIKSLQAKCISLLGMPDLFKKYGQTEPNLASLKFVSILLWNTATTRLRKTLIDEGVEPFPRKSSKKSTLLRVRLLSSYGFYPNIRLKSEGFRYSFIGNRPLLVTEETESDSNSEVSSMNLNELIFSSSLALSPNFPRCNVHFVEGSYLLFQSEILEGIESYNRENLLYELLLAYQDKTKSKEFQFEVQELPQVVAFQDFEDNRELFYKIAKLIDRSNQLLLRTLFYFVKSRMLWSNRCFGEDAIANVFFTLEGSLHLLQDMSGKMDGKIDKSLLLSIFESNFRRGEELFDFVMEAYDKRIQLVHANPRNGAEWEPFLMADDFYEYYDIARTLILFYLTGDVYEYDPILETV